MRVKLDEVDLDRCWRFALPVAAVGVVLSGATVALIVVPDAPPDAVIGLVAVTFLALLPVHLGAILTDQRLEQRRGGDRSRDRSAVSWIVCSGIGAAVLLAALRWPDAWAGPDGEWLLPAMLGLFHATGFQTGLRYRREVRARRDRGGFEAGDARVVASSVPPPTAWSGQVDTSAVGSVAALPRGPWSFPTAKGAGAAADRRSGWPQLVWPRPGPPRRRLRRTASTVPGFLPAVVGFLVVVLFIASRQGYDTLVGDRDRPFYVATPVALEETSFAFEGDLLRAPPDRVWAAACRNYRNFLRNRTLGPDVVIIDDADLVRSAELLDGAYADDQVAIDAETFIVQEGSLVDAVGRLRDEGWPEADIEHAMTYYRDRRDPASAAAHDRYVIFTTSTTRSAGVVARLAVDPEQELTSKPALTPGIRDIAVRLPDGSTVRIDESLCWD